MFIVELRSEAYGTEAFHYDTLDEMLDAMRELTESCQEEYAKDGIEREVAVLISSGAS